MAIYDTEEEQLEALKRWWKENGTSTIVGLAIGIAVIAGLNYRQEYKRDQANQASSIYDQLLKAAETDQKDSVDKLAKKLQEQFSGSDYAAYGALFQAKVSVEKGDIATAKDILKKIADGPDKELSHVAKIRLVKLMLASGEYEQGLKVINTVDQSSSSKFSDNYDELVGDLYVALDRLDEARTAYQKALKNGYQSPLLQLKIDDLTAPEKVEAKK
ncbi:MAG: tetratricopeptide repeat protein [Methylococcaceae bacterium]|nr:tetratricopeptide repeat protein [Methylococcaceae bacterium]